jgi:GNAT superfamily N-acetyltransferase
VIRYRWMAEGEEDAVLALVMRGFDASVRSGFRKAGVAEFSRAARTFVLDHPAGHRILLADVDGTLAGMIDLRDGSHVCLFFVEPSHQGRGLGSALFAEAIRRGLARDPDITAITVNSAPSAVGAYLKLGFVPTAPVAEQNGIRFVAMRKPLPERAVDLSAPTG